MPSSLPRHLHLSDALRDFVTATSTQSQRHIRPTHAYVATRLAIEGGFLPDEITPHPPLRAESRRSHHQLILDPTVQDSRERTLVGGLKSKDVDVVVCKDVDVVVCKEGMGPVFCISVKGTGNAFRNLTNRMEEAIGDCTNLHVMYPGIVYGFLHLLKANREGDPGVAGNDICIGADGEPIQAVVRYHDLLADLTGRRFVRNDFTRYEAVGLLLVEAAAEKAGQILEGFPEADSPLQTDDFFTVLYTTYDLRYPFRNPKIRRAERVTWDEDSPAFDAIREATGADVAAALGYEPRLS